MEPQVMNMAFAHSDSGGHPPYGASMPIEPAITCAIAAPPADDSLPLRPFVSSGAATVWAGPPAVPDLDASAEPLDPWHPMPAAEADPAVGIDEEGNPLAYGFDSAADFLGQETDSVLDAMARAWDAVESGIQELVEAVERDWDDSAGDAPELDDFLLDEDVSPTPEVTYDHVPDLATGRIAARLQALGEELERDGDDALARWVREGDRFDTLLAGIVAGFLAARRE
jgi:hypothetical protein